MKLHDDGDFTALNWVKQALDATLAQAREALEAYVEQPGNLDPMRSCVTHLHQVQGTLRMVELYGAAMVVENMERLAEGLVDNSVRQREESYSVLMRGMVQLPDYLERLQSGHKDIPIVLLPLLNDLRACRGENLLSESALFSPDLNLSLPAVADGAAQPLGVGDLRAQALRLRLGFQAALLKWFRDEGAAEHLRRLIDVLDRLRTISFGAEARRLWWIAAGVIEAVENHGLEATVAVKLLFGRVDREIHRFAAGEAAFAATAPRELTKNLLYYVAHSTGAGARGAQIRSTYRLDTLLPTPSELQHAQGSMTGRNRNLLGTVSSAIKDDLLRVKEALDIFLRSRNSDPGELLGQVEVLDRVGDTLGMLGLGVPRRVVSEQREVVQEMAQRRRAVDEGALLDVAGALLYVEASLDDHIERLGAGSDSDATGDGALELPKAEVRKILDALMREAAVNIQQAKHDIIAFIESPWDHARVDQIPRLLEEIAGALRMLGLAEAAQLMTAIVRFVEVELITHRRVPTAEQMDKLADALAAIEYYLEATREQRRNREKILDVARDSLESLGYWPLSSAPERPLPDLPGGDDGGGSGGGNPEPVAPAAPSDAAASAALAPPGPSADQTASFDLQAAADLAYGGRAADAASYEAAHARLPSVEIAPGNDLHDLIVGATEASAPAEHDLSGLRFADTGAADAQSADAHGWTEIEEEIEEDVPVEESPAQGFQTSGGGEIDDDIREVFVEEVEEELGNLRRQVPLWKRDVDNLEELKPIRRSFHTLKGSGRLVGALALGEFSWKVESLLNRVLDSSIAAGSAVVALVDHAVEAIPSLLAALRGDGGGNANIAGIMDTADRLAAGEEAWLPAQPTATRKVKRIVRRRVPLFSAELPSLTDDVHGTGSLADEGGFGDIAFDDSAFGASPAEIIAGPLPNIDPVLFDILQSEVTAHLGVIEDYLARCATEPVRASEPLLRAVHTLNGAISMVDIPSIGDVLSPLESYVKRLRGIVGVPDAEGIAVLRETVDLTRDVMQRLEARRADLPDSSALAARVAALRDALPEPELSLHLYSEADADTPSTLAAAVATTGEPEHPAASLPDTGGDITGDWVHGNVSAPVEKIAHSPLDTQIPADLVASLAGFDADATPASSIDREETPAVADEDASDVVFDGLPAFIDAAQLETFEPAAPEAAPPAAAEGPDVHAEDLLGEPVAAQPLAMLHSPQRDDAPPAEPLAATPLAGAEAPALADDPQPDGPLEALDVDDDLLDIFVQEGADILDHSDTLVADLRAAPHERTHIAGLQRDLHTLKGGARMAGLAPIGDLSHAMESLVDAISDGSRAVDRAAVESLERGFDRLHVLVKRVAHRRAIAMPVHAIARFESLVAGDALVAPPATAEQEAIAPRPVVVGTPSAPAAPLADDVARPSPRHLTALDQEEMPHAPQEMIRVRSDLLDNLVNAAGEVSIYRSRLEQQISTFRFNLIEFDQTVTRLREQLRKLEIETEAQIIARYQREHHDAAASIGAFDPLELDRFSLLQQLSRGLGESVSDLVSIQGLLDEQTRQSETLLLQQSRVSSELQEGLMRTRMVPFDSMVPNLRRTLRQAALEVDKRAQLKVDGAHGEMDRNLLERMKAPFEHMLRNALAHGIETPDERIAAGKPPEGTVNIAVSRESTEVVLRVSDDGRGMDREAIRRKAIERGLLKPEAQLPDRDLYGFVLESGFSTAEQITQLAGRGVGMDVVHNEIKQLGGSLAIDSKAGSGTHFTIRLPFTLAVTQAILVKLGEASYAIPMSSVQGVARIARDDLDRRVAAGNPKHLYGGEEFVIYDLAQLLGLPRGRPADDMQVPLLMTRTGDQRAAVRIDGVVGSREVVVKSVGPQVSSVPGIFGATIMGDGSVVMILDLAPLVRRLAAQRARIDAGIEQEAPEYLAPAPVIMPDVRLKPLVMVVDDSITMRKVTTRVLERADFDVATAKDGLDALEKLQDSVPDLMLLDIEMPRMDGYELATYMRNDPRMKQVPIIMITSRTGEKHRQRALEIGVERYLGKPYQEEDLLRQVQEVLRRERV
ncbi:MAG: Hpt domain-containing protein [Dokdonella sp.]